MSPLSLAHCRLSQREGGEKERARDAHIQNSTGIANKENEENEVVFG